jgi:phage shock protein A
MARARLHDRHQLTLKRKLQKIKQEQGIFHAPISSTSTKISSASTSTIPKKKKDSENNQLDSFDNENEIESFEDLETKCLREYDEGRYSPILVNINDLDLEIQKRCTDETDDWEKLKQQRESVMKSGSVKPDVEDAFEAFARSMGSLTADDSVINTVVPMDVQYLWSDKYRPRKPRVFNKVHTVWICCGQN